MDKIIKAWSKIPQSWRVEILSAWHTFVPAFVTALVFQIETMGEIKWGLDVIISLILTASRSAFKVLWAWFVAKVTVPSKK